ncbi:hypothetical protein [Roseateles amylovorans]|uniref:Glycosyltransferase family 2 protein n=1 Tax=Roseateles amylovorans TaxID=2978473 RepID=A0ABY6AXT2_9BURK|nr:hypothetical protein [Roseateles amylovorans]UXH76671.1 hypothetical protein N4261_16700 [Roseateles amylovorans]
MTAPASHGARSTATSPALHANFPEADPPAPVRRPVVLVSWDGQSQPLGLVHLNATPEFDWLLFDYTGRQATGPRQWRGQSITVLAAATECKGEIYHHLAEHLILEQAEGAATPEYVALIDDDILISVSQLNTALHLGRAERLDVFSPSLSHDSPFSHQWMRHQPNRIYREVDWVEVMMPFYRGALFLAGRDYYRDNISSWGVDRFLMPTLQQLAGQTRTALLDAVMASHRRPVTSGGKVYRNGRTAWQERQVLRQASLDLIDRQQPALRDTAWFHRLFIARETPNKWKRVKRRLARSVARWLDDWS